MNARFVSKAHALLAQVDPRQGGLQRSQWAEQHLGPITNRETLTDDFRDAYDAQVMLADRAQSAELVAVRSLNPLSGEEVEGRFYAEREWQEADQGLEADPAVLAALARWRESAEDGAAAPAWYRDLWFAVQRFANDHWPRLPGSMLLPDHSLWAHRGLAAALRGARHDGDEAALLLLQVGPVQRFIESARRTHDLWVGSYTIAFLTFHAVKRIAELEGPDAIIYPDLEHLPLARQLLFGEVPQPRERVELLWSSLANHFVAVVPRRRGIELAKAAAKAARDAWQKMGEAALNELKGCGLNAFQSFHEQLDDHLEIDAALQPWRKSLTELASLFDELKLAERERGLVPLLSKRPDSHPGAAYGSLFNLAHRQLRAHRRALPHGAWHGDGRPKCSQCGDREQMGPVTGGPNQQRESQKFFVELSKGLQQRNSKDDNLRLSLQIVRGEGLCAVCLTKRLAPEVYFGRKAAELGLDWGRREDRGLLRFPSLATIATAPLRAQILKHPGHPVVNRWLGLLAQLDRLLDFEPPGSLLPGLARSGADPRILRLEGSWLYESSYEPRTAWRNHYPDSEPWRDGAAEGERKKYGELSKVLADAKEAFRDVRRLVGQGASEHYAVIVMDGDYMGQWLTGTHKDSPRFSELCNRRAALDSELATQHRPLFPALHGDLSRRLGKLAVTEVRRVVEDRYCGRVVYSGGDDLLALVPVADLLGCLEDLRRLMREPRFLGKLFTASAGVAIRHWRSPFGEALRSAREAEKEAKRAGRDAVVLRLRKRSSESLQVTLPLTLRPGVRSAAEPGTKESQGVMTSTLQALSALLRPPADWRPAGDGQGWSLLRSSLGHALRQEVPALAHMGDHASEAFIARLCDHLGIGRPRPEASSEGRGAVLLQILQQRLDERKLDAIPPDQRHDIRKKVFNEVVNLLLVLRFLAAEQWTITEAPTDTGEQS